MQAASNYFFCVLILWVCKYRQVNLFNALHCHWSAQCVEGNLLVSMNIMCAWQDCSFGSNDWSWWVACSSESRWVLLQAHVSSQSLSFTLQNRLLGLKRWRELSCVVRKVCTIPCRKVLYCLQWWSWLGIPALAQGKNDNSIRGTSGFVPCLDLPHGEQALKILLTIVQKTCYHGFGCMQVFALSVPMKRNIRQLHVHIFNRTLIHTHESRCTLGDAFRFEANKEKLTHVHTTHGACTQHAHTFDAWLRKS